MKSFDEWFDKENPFNGNADNDDCLWAKKWMMVAYESRQAEVDKLQTEIDCLKIEICGTNERALMMFNHKNNMVEKMQAEIDELQAMYEKQGLYAFELQKRIDEAWNELDDRYSKEYIIERIENILKGNQDA